jgi:RimJ/RimL family protein N-acetyltransferase
MSRTNSDEQSHAPESRVCRVFKASITCRDRDDAWRYMAKDYALIVRNSHPADIEAILAIKRDTQVAKLQYKFNQTAYAAFLSRVLAGDNATGIITTLFSSIEEGGAILGYIRHDHYVVDETKMVQCSFNLSSAHWGQGRMKIALTQLINEWIGSSGVHHVFADHFRTNARCERLLTGLQFERQNISMIERACTVLQQRCFQWIIRRRLDAPKWTLANNARAM